MEITISHNNERASSVFQLGTEAESTQATGDIYEKEEAIEVDYSALRDDLKVTGRFLFRLIHGDIEYLNIIQKKF